MATAPHDVSAPRHAPGAAAFDARHAVRSFVSRYFFGSTAVFAGFAALQFALLQPALSGQRRFVVSLCFGLLALLALAALRARAAWIDRAMFAVMATASLAIAAIAVMLGWGLETPGLAFYGLFVCLLCAAAGWRMGILLAGVLLFALVGIELAVPVARNAPPAAWRFTSLVVLVAAGLSGGLLVSYVIGRYTRSVADREQRFRGLLAIAADAYWEIDEHYRLVAVNHQHNARVTLQAAGVLGQVPWELAQFGCDAETLDALLADLDARQPFRDRLVHWQGRGGRVHALAVSGEPRFDERRIFKGYWGVVRDVTQDLAARNALAATETRYQELFARIPTPLVLHRHGHLIDANPAALALLGHEDLGAALGRDLFAAYEAGDSRERERRRIEELAEQPAGAALPVADFRLLPAHGRRVAVRTTAVRVDAEGGPATLSIYVDDTERRAAEEAVRRSETMLSHLVATSPDVITLTDLSTGRYAMVNRTFEHVTGYPAPEVIGRTSIELGIWVRADDRQRFVSQVRALGAVTDMPTEFNAKDGRVLPMLVSGARFVMDRREYLVINARDVSEAERSRLEREAILENASIGIAVSRDQRFVTANPRFEQMLGWAPGALAGEPGSAVWPDEAAYREVGSDITPALARG